MCDHAADDVNFSVHDLLSMLPWAIHDPADRSEEVMALNVARFTQIRMVTWRISNSKKIIESAQPVLSRILQFSPRKNPH